VVLEGDNGAGIRLCVCSLGAGFQFPINPKHQQDTTSRAIKNVGKKVRWILQSQICQGFYFGFVTTFISGQAKNLFSGTKKGGKIELGGFLLYCLVETSLLPHSCERNYLRNDKRLEMLMEEPIHYIHRTVLVSVATSPPNRDHHQQSRSNTYNMVSQEEGREYTSPLKKDKKKILIKSLVSDSFRDYINSFFS
jgi:hypothetical protein